MTLHNAPCRDIKKATTPISVHLPDKRTMRNTHEGFLNLPQLPPEACKTYLFNDMQSSLVSIGQLCDAGCLATFDKDTVSIKKNNALILQGNRDPATGLWTADLSNQPPAASSTASHVAMSAIAAETIGERIAFLHACAGSPALSTFRKAIDSGYFTTWPELTASRVDKYLVAPAATIKGHLDQQRKNIRSTKPKAKPKSSTPYQFPGQEETAAEQQPISPEERCNHVFLTCSAITGQIYSDQPGQFLVSSTSGMSYMMVAHCYDSNAILAVPMPSRTGPSLLNAYKEVHRILTSRGFRPQYQRLDNEISKVFKDFLQPISVDYQLTPTGSHRRNTAERAIRTWKNHFIAILCSTDEAFPLKLWDRLLEQAQITLNLLRGSRVNPQLSAQAQLHGAFDFNQTPLGPPGTRVLIHELPDKRGTWSPHAVLGFYTGPASEHYRCYKVWVLETGAERIANTLLWFPTQVPLPRTSSADAATAAAQDLIHALKHPHAASPLSPLADEHQSALRQLATIFNSAAPSPAPVPRVEHATPPLPAVPRADSDGFTFVSKTRNRGQVRREEKAAQRKADHSPAKPPARFASPNRFDVLDDDVLPPPKQPTAPSKRKQPKAQKASKPPHPPRPVTLPPRPRRHGHATRLRVKYRAAQHQQAQYQSASNHAVFDCTSNPHRDHFVNSVIDPTTGQSLEYRHLIKGPEAQHYLQANINEIGRLTDGRVGGPEITGTNTGKFLHPSQLPSGRTATYLRPVVTYRRQKADPYRMRWTVGGNLIDYPGVTSTPGSEMTTIKLLVNSTISTPDARFMCCDAKDFYLNTTMHRKEYMWVPASLLPDVVIAAYALADLIVNGRVLFEISKGMYGLPQAGRLAYDQLVEHLAPHGYRPVPRTPGLWKHDTRPVTFCLVVDDFGVKYVGKQHADHLLNAVRTKYQLTCDWAGSLYCGITLTWDYNKGTVDLSMPGYIDRALHKFQHAKPYRPEHAPHAWNEPVYGRSTQLVSPTDDSPLLDKEGILRVQSITGTALFYARAVDPTALVAIGTISAEQSKATENTNKKITRLLNYFATHPNASIRYHRSGMVLYIHSDASYLSERNARSRMGGHFFLSNPPTDTTRQPLATDTPPPENGAVHTNSTILKVVVASAAEAETGGMFYNSQDAIPMRVALAEMGHPQPPTHVRGDNSTAIGIANRTIKQRRSKAMDMRYFWLQDRDAQGQFKYYWDKGEGNRADYFTKHHSVAHHRAMRPVYLCPEPHTPSI